MKLRALFLLMAAALAFWSCEKENYSPRPQDTSTASIMGVGQVIKGNVIVKFSETPQTKSIAGSVPELQILSMDRLFPENETFAERHKRHGLDRWYRITFNPEVPVSVAYKAMKSLEHVEVVDYVPVIKQASTPPFNDPDLSYQWHYNNSGQGNGYVSGMDMNLFKAWEKETGDPSVIVAVLDQGVEYNHDDLAKNMWINTAEKNGTTGIDDDNNGYVDDIHGYNFCAVGNSNAMYGSIQPGNHGTHVAGTIAAVNGNNTFGCGIAGGNGANPGVSIMTCQTMNNNKDGSYIGVAFVYAADNGAVITQNSWSLDGSSSTPQYIVEAIEYFNANAGFDARGNQVGPMAGGITIFAAGNENSDIGVPAMIDQVIAVSATGPNGKKASYSNYGKWVDIAAPGGENGTYPMGNVYSTVTGNQFGQMSGTSMACPHVSGVAALVVSRYGGEGFTNTKLKEILLESADYDKLYDVNPDYKARQVSALISTPDRLGAGALDAYKAVTFLGDVEDDDDDDNEPTDVVPDPVTKVEATATPNSITVTWEATETAGKPTFEYNLYISEKDMSGMDLNPNDYIEGVSFDKVHGDGKKAGEKISYTLNNTKHSTTYYLAVQSESVTFKYSEASPQISITTPANLPPAISPDENIAVTLKATQKQSFEFNISDPENDNLSVWLEGESSVANLNRNGNTATVTIDALKGEPGTYTATLYVRDAVYNTANVEIAYTILPNNAPVSMKGFSNLVLDKGQSATFNLEEYFSDADGDKLSYVFESSESSTVTCAVQGNTLTVSALSYGSSDITVRAKDGRNATSGTATMKVLARNTKEAADVFPTSVQSTLNIRTATDGNADILITGASGAAVYTKTSVATGPFNPHTINASEWGAGVYSVEVTVNGQKCKKTVVKL